jgi:copper(I)-binding protein
MTHRLLAILFAVFLMQGVVAEPQGSGTAQSLQVSNGWVRAGPPGMMVLAGYFRLTNTSTQDVVVTSVSSPDFKMVEMHRTVVEDRVARMEAQEQLKVPAGGELALAPGGLHLMLMHPVRTLGAGDIVTLKLHLRGNDPITITAPVKKEQPSKSQH